MMPPPAVSVVMVVYRTGPALFETIPMALAEPLVDELVVVDNGSSIVDAEALREIAAREPRLRLLQGHGNIGFARGCNLGVREARGVQLVVLNPDAYLQPGCVQALIEGANGFPRPCVVGARVLNPDGNDQRGARRGEVTPFTTLVSVTRLASALAFLRRFDIHLEREPVPGGPTPVPTISGACFSMSRSDYEALGGFDERYFLHVEDIDLCWRARRMGGSVVFQPAARVMHLHSTSRSPKLIVEWHKGRGLARYFRKRAAGPWAWVAAAALGPMILAISVLRAIIARREKSHPGG